MGPTASGKTGMAMELVQRSPCQIISVDSAQVYKGLDIGSGKPTQAELNLAPHRLIDIVDPSYAYSASEFRRDAIREIEDVLAAGDTPLLVGGTMLYFKVLRDGLAKMPNANPDIRQKILDTAEQQGWEEVHRQLEQVDPESAARIHPNDPQRLQRALEVYEVSGKTMTELHREKNGDSSLELPFKLHFFGIQPEDRAALHKQIESRFRQMLADGVLAEVQALYARADLNSQLPSIKSVGYRQIWQHLSGEISYEEMVEKSIIATRQLAKRQLTWLRSWDELIPLADPSAKSIDKALKYMASTTI
jgi:tRNA dimethylallyltransferase